MRKVLVADTERYSVVDYAHGLGAEIVRKQDGLSCFLQGDDARGLLSAVDRAAHQEQQDWACEVFDLILQDWPGAGQFDSKAVKTTH